MSDKRQAQGRQPQAITQEQVIEAASAGVELLSPGSNTPVPAGRMGQLLLLRQLLAGVANGTLVFAAAPPSPTSEVEGANEEAPRPKSGRKRS